MFCAGESLPLTMYFETRGQCMNRMAYFFGEYRLFDEARLIRGKHEQQRSKPRVH